MAFTDKQKQLLEGDLDAKHVRSRQGSGNFTMSYIEGWHAIAEANRIFGHDGWTSETVLLQCVSDRETSWRRKDGNQWITVEGQKVSYIAKCRVTVGGIVREGTGAGHGKDADAGIAHESAIKEAETDARKRALMTLGNKFGLALYDKEKANVSVGADDADEQTSREPSRSHVDDREAGSTEADLDSSQVQHDPETGELPSSAQGYPQPSGPVRAELMNLLRQLAPGDREAHRYYAEKAKALKPHLSPGDIKVVELCEEEIRGLIKTYRSRSKAKPPAASRRKSSEQGAVA